MSGPFRNGDIVGVSHLGRDFMATVEGEDGQTLFVHPIPANITYFTVSKREVKSHWPFRKGSRVPLVKHNGGLTYG